MGSNFGNLGAITQAFGVIGNSPIHFGQGPNGLLDIVSDELVKPLSPVFSDTIPDLSDDAFLPPFLTGIDSIAGILGGNKPAAASSGLVHFGQGPNGLLNDLVGFLVPPLARSFNPTLPDLSSDPFLPPFLGAIDDIREILGTGDAGEEAAEAAKPADNKKTTKDTDAATATKTAERAAPAKKAAPAKPKMVTKPAPVAFDEAYYLKTNPDVAAAVKRGEFKSGLQHYQRHGAKEGRNPNADFNEAYYLKQNPDVAAAVKKGDFPSAFAHYQEWGAKENRKPNDSNTKFVA